MSMNNENKPQDNELHDGLKNEPEENMETEIAGTSEVEAPEAEETKAETADTEIAKAGDASEKKSDGKDQKKKSRMKSRNFRYGSMATALTLIVIAAVVLINVVAGILNDRFPANLDLTKNQVFSLCGDSKQVAKGVNSDVVITVFTDESTFSSPSTGVDAINTVFKQFYQATKQYASLSNGKVSIKFMDLTKNPAEAQNYTKYNPQTGDILFQCGNRYEKGSYSDLYTEDQNSYYTGQTASYSSKVEQLLASKVTMVTSENTPEAMIFTGHDEDSTTQSGISDMLGANNYTTKNMDITSSTAFDDNAVLAVIPAPASDYSEEEITKLRDWLNNSGNLDHHLLVVANYKADCPNLYQFLNVEYGIEVTDNLVVETDNSRIYGYNGYQPYGDIASTDFTKEISSKKDLLPACRQLLTNKDSNTQNSLYNIDVVTFPKTSKLVSLKDAMNQNNSSKITPSDAPEYPVIGLAYATKTSYDSNSTAHSTNVVVSGSNGMFNSQITSMSSVYNEKTVVSLLNGFTGNKDAVSIPSKSLTATQLEFNTAQAYIFWVVFVVLVPLTLLVICLVVFLRRRRL